MALFAFSLPLFKTAAKRFGLFSNYARRIFEVLTNVKQQEPALDK